MYLRPLSLGDRLGSPQCWHGTVQLLSISSSEKSSWLNDVGPKHSLQSQITLHLRLSEHPGLNPWTQDFARGASPCRFLQTPSELSCEQMPPATTPICLFPQGSSEVTTHHKATSGVRKTRMKGERVSHCPNPWQQPATARLGPRAHHPSL